MAEMSPVHPEDVMDIWPDIEKHLRDANSYNDERVPLHYWLMRILQGTADLFVSPDMEAAGVCEVVEYPNRRVYLSVLFGGNGEYTLAFRDVCVQAAKFRKCDCLEARGRPGWKKVMKEWGAELLHCHWKLEI